MKLTTTMLFIGEEDVLNITTAIKMNAEAMSQLLVTPSSVG
jgi:hypothetical protein